MSKRRSLFEFDSQKGFSLRSNYQWKFLLGLVFLLGLSLRLYDLGAESYWIDEITTIIEGKQNTGELLISGRLDQPPGYYLPFHAWIQMFGTSEVSTRSFSILAGLGSVVLIYWIGQELFHEAVGLISAFMMVISEYQIYYSQIARFYSFFVLTTLFSFLFFILALERKKLIHFAFYTGTSIIMFYGHPYGIFILLAQNLFFTLQIKKYKDLLSAWLLCQVLIMLAFAPYFYPLIFGENGIREAAALNSGKYPAPSLLDPLRTVYRFILPARRERPWESILATYALAGVWLALGTWVYTLRKGKSKFKAEISRSVVNLQEMPNLGSKLLLISCWLLSPILVPFILSIVIVPIYTDRYTISAAPALYLLLALGIFGLRKIMPLAISLGVLAIMSLSGLHYYYVTDVNAQWKEVALYIEGNSSPGEMIVFAPNMGLGIQQKTFSWYYRGSLQSCGLPNRISTDAIPKALAQCVSEHSRFWVIIPEEVEHYRSFFLGPDQTTLHLIKERHFVLISVYLFTR